MSPPEERPASAGEGAEAARLPPGPPNVLANTARFLRDPFGLLAACERRYGDPFTLRTLAGATVITGHPEGVREIFSADPAGFEPFDLMRPLLGDASLFIVSGARHKRDRKLLMPPFHGARMRAYGGIVVEETLRAFSALRPGERFAMQEVAQAISLRVILRAIFGVEDETRAAALGKEILAVTGAVSPLLLFVKPLRKGFFGLSRWDRFVAARARLDALVFAEIAARRSAGEGAGSTDILGLLLAARDESGAALDAQEIRDELVAFFFAGHESTSLAIAWLFDNLHRAPEALARLRDELATLSAPLDPDALARLPFLDACCSESLRLYPLVPQVSRKLRAPLTLRGYALPAGIGVAASPSLAHRRPDFFPNPGAFEPERFLARSFSAFEFFPFGGGARRCLGAAFALYEMKLVLAAALPRFELAPAFSRRPRVVRGSITLGPEGGAPFRLLGTRPDHPPARL